MKFDHYQAEVVRLSEPVDFEHELVPMLGLGGHVGDLQLVQQRYLCESLVADTSKGMIGRELGMILRWSALMAYQNGLALNEIAHANLIKVDQRARSLELPGISRLADRSAALTADEYSRLAAETDQEITAGADPLSLSVPLLGLAGEAGNLAVEMKKRYRRDSEIDDWRSFIAEEVGDLLWYATTVARHARIGLEDVAVGDLRRLRRSAPFDSGEGLSPRGFDAEFPPQEQFPRQLQLHFKERLEGGKAFVAMTIISAVPNAFPYGPTPRGNDKFQGFQVGAQLGDEVTDNSRRTDAYRYHDAIHLGFLAVLGWSPNLRGLLRVKRKSDAGVDEAEDGARAIFAEEGIAAILAKQAPASRQFEAPNLVPEELLDIVAAVVEDLEVNDLPYRLWRQAISQGFSVLRQLNEAGAGYVLADLDARTLQYSKFPFAI